MSESAAASVFEEPQGTASAPERLERAGPAVGASDDGGHHWRRILHGVGANLLGKVWVVIGQALSVPILLSVWGASGYGVWLMLSAVPTYVVLSDFGFGSAAAITMTQMVTRGDTERAAGLFQSAWLVVTGILAVLIALSVGAWFALGDIARLLHSPPPSNDVRTAFLLLTVYSVALVEMGILLVGFRSTKRYARGTFLFDLAMPIETVMVLVAAVVAKTFTACALAFIAVRVPALVAYYIVLRREVPWLRIGWSKASWRDVRDLMQPAVANFAMPLGLAMGVQGVLFTIGLAFGATAAGVFGAVRTITRVPLQMSGVLTRASQPEMTIAYSLENRPLLARLTVLNLLISILVVAPFALIAPKGDLLVRFVSHGRVAVSDNFYFTLAVVASIQSLWSAFVMFIFAENKLQRVVPWCLLVGVLEMAAPFLLRGRSGLTGVVVAVVAAEALNLAAAFLIWRRSVGLTGAELSHAVADLLQVCRSRLERAG